MSPRPRRADRHPDLHSAIKQTAWKQIAATGAATLNLRGIARELGITAPSIYNYFSNRDALVTALIVEAFLSLGDSQAAALQAVPESDYAERLRALGLAYRAWAVAYPERYQLIFGTPIAGYVAPEEVTLPAAARSLTMLVGALQAAQAAGRLRAETPPEMPRAVRAMFSAWSRMHGPADEQALFLALSIWGQVHGLVSLEIGQQLPSALTEPGQVYRYVIDLLVARYLPEAIA